MEGDPVNEPQALLVAGAPLRAYLHPNPTRLIADGPDAQALTAPGGWPTVRALAVVLPERHAELHDRDPDAATGKLLALCALLQAMIVKRRGARSAITWQVIPIPNPAEIDPEHLWSLVETNADHVAVVNYLTRRRFDLEGGT
jgi:hypothetical protein